MERDKAIIPKKEIQEMKILFELNQYNQQRQREKPRWIYPINLAMYATYLYNQGNQIVWDGIDDGTFDKVITSEKQIDIPFLELPHANRILTDAINSKWQRNGNYKYHPGTYIQSAGGCWWGKCVFCKEKGQKYVLRKVEDVIKEIRYCQRQGFKEIFDDAATLATGEWREKFLWELNLIDIVFSCNMRFGTLKSLDFLNLKKAGFRMLLYGLESANQKTLDKINKGINVDEAIHEVMLASRYGLESHIAVIFGYPWETEEDALNTLRLVHWLLRKGYAKTAQASLYDVKDTPPNMDHAKYVHQIYRAGLYPNFWINKIKDVKSVADMKYIWRGIKSCFGI